MSALYDLYTSTNGEQWQWKRDGAVWNFTGEPNPCVDGWQGITCNTVAPTQPRYVRQLSLTRYNLKGLLPSSIANLTSLVELVLAGNRLSGTIPTEVGHMSSAEYISLALNNFTSTVPSSFAQLSSLTRLELHTNNLNGTLPGFLCNVTNLGTLTLFHNFFTGTIPNCWGNLTQMQELDINGNTIQSSLPASFGNIRGMVSIMTYGNFLTGTIPDTYCNMVSLRQFVVRTNLFTGSIPSCVGAWRNMTYFDVSDNQLTGTLPAGLGQAPHLELLWAHNNSLRGTIPPEWGHLHKLRELYLHQNRLTGTIPATVSGMDKLAYLYLQNNRLTGTIPPQLGLSEMVLLYLNDNLLSGTIPAQFANALSLQEVFLQGNRLRGSLAGLFNRTTHKTLNIVQVSENQLTGALPEEIFALPRLSTFAASANCFTGALTDAFCSSKVLSTVILDGLHSSSACRNPLIPLAHSYTLSGRGHGTVPACMFHMPKLVTLHLSANGLTGTLPDTLLPDTKLTDLALSHNALTGTIPVAYQRRYWSNLDLSFNRLSGALQSDFEVFPAEATTYYGTNITTNSTDDGVTYALQNNRLSGRVPAALVNFVNVSMLGSNMFSCKLDKSDLPKHDGDYYTYQCASSSFDYSYYVFLGAVITCVAVLAFMLFLPTLAASLPLLSKLAECLRSWRVDHKVLVTLRHFRYVAAVSDILGHIAALCTALIVVVLVPWYAVASHYFGTYTHQYAWVISAGFKSGVTPAVVGTVLYIAFVLAIAVSCLYFVVRRDSRLQRTSGHLHVRTSANSTFTVDPHMVSAPRRVGIYVAFFVVNLIFVVGVNVAFVSVALTQSNAVLFLAQILLSMFKLIWNTVCAPNLIRFAARRISQAYHSAGFVSIQVFVALLNNVAIPCVVVAVVSPSCFTSAFSPPPDVHSSFNFYPTIRPGPDLVHVNGYVAVDYISYKPPFSYDYQCSSSFVTYYAPAFIYLALGAGVVAPTLKALALLMFTYSAPDSWMRRVSLAVLPNILKPPPPPLAPPLTDVTQSPPAASHPQPQSAAEVAQALETTTPQPAQHRSPQAALQPERPSQQVSANRTSEDTAVARPRHRYLFDANIYIVTQITYLGILVTFGVVFPPLAVAMCVTMLSVAWQGKLLVGRFLFNARQDGAQYLVDLIEQECKGAVSMEKLRLSLFIIICYACSFYAMFLFDTLGNAVGVLRAFWLLILMPLLPVLLYVLARLRQCREAATGTKRGLGFSLDDTLFELRVRGAQHPTTSDPDNQEQSADASVGRRSSGSDTDDVTGYEGNQDDGVSTVNVLTAAANGGGNMV
jgi:Leucine-rich repeat (LRR) protein